MDQPIKSTEKVGPPLFGLPDHDVLPERFGPYQILDKISESLGIVYKARQSNPDRTVALKIPAAGKLLTREDMAAFEREIAVAAQLDHSAIVPVLETGVVNGTPYYTMPFVEGRDLYSEVMVAALDWPARLALFKKVCRAVQSLHDHHLIHRDLKPNNILVDRHHDIRLLDFGLAKTLDAPARQKGASVVAGTLQFMAPEQTQGQDSLLTPACDVYALGVMLYWMAGNQAPYNLPSDTQEAFRIIREGAITPPSRTGTSIAPPEYDTVICACLNKNPSLRPRDAGDLLAVLRRVEKSTRVIAGQGAPSKASTSTAQATSTAIAEPEGSGRSPLVPVLLVTGGLLLLAPAWLLLSNPSTDDPPLPNNTTTPIQQVISVVIDPEGSGTTNQPAAPVVPENKAEPVSTNRLLWTEHDLSRQSFDAVRAGAVARLQNEFDLRDHGVVLVRFEQNGRLTVTNPRDGATTELRGQAGHAICMFLPSAKPIAWQWVAASRREAGEWVPGRQAVLRHQFD